MATLISDISTLVLLKVENRTASGDVTNSYDWIKKALIDLCTNRQFRDDLTELEVIGPTFNLTAGTQEYAETLFVNTAGGDLNMATLDVKLWTDVPAGSNFIVMEPSSYQWTDRGGANQGRPTKCYRYGSNIGFFATPDATYQVQARCLRYHSFSNPIQNTPLLIPVELEEILIWAAVKRGWAELEAFDKVMNVDRLLHGDPKHPDRTGLIESYKTKSSREDHRVSFSIRPTIRRYTRG